MKIQLDTGAMNALFPEGSQARVDLQNAVIANFARKTLDNFIDDEVKKTVRNVIGYSIPTQQIDELARKTVSDMFDQTGTYWNKAFKVRNGGSLDQALNNHAKSLASKAVDDWKRTGELCVSSHIEYMKNNLAKEFERLSKNELVNLNQSIATVIQSEINNIIRAELQKALSGNSLLSNG